jgi:hypothetical protein
MGIQLGNLKYIMKVLMYSSYELTDQLSKMRCMENLNLSILTNPSMRILCN